VSGSRSLFTTARCEQLTTISLRPARRTLSYEPAAAGSQGGRATRLHAVSHGGGRDAKCRDRPATWPAARQEAGKAYRALPEME
jgi:hypothetical protein